MLNSQRLAAVLRIVDEIENPEMKVSAVADLETPEELQTLANCYNWDDGLAVPTAIAEHPKCDLGVALNLFWLADAICLFTKEIEPDEYNRDWVAFCNRITAAIVNGEYRNGETSFHVGLGVARHYKYRKKGVPEILISDVVANLPPSAV